MTPNLLSISSEIPSNAPTTPLEQELLSTFQAWVLRLLSDPKSKPSQVLNAVRRLEMMRDFPMRQEKQARSLALAEARVDLRRRSLALREALLQERLTRSAEKKARSIAKRAPLPEPTVAVQPVKATPLATESLEKSAPIEVNKVSAVKPATQPLVLKTSKCIGVIQSMKMDPCLTPLILSPVKTAHAWSK